MDGLFTSDSSPPAAQKLAQHFPSGSMAPVSSVPQSAQVARECSYVQTARLRVEAMRASQGETLGEPVVEELESALGKRVRECELRGQNWRNRVYRIVFDDGTLAAAKQLVMGDDAMLRYQYRQLQALAELQIPGLRVPKALGLLPEKRVLVMEFAPGINIEALAWKSSDVLPACDLAGKILARIQLARTETIAPMPVEMLRRDFAAAPWRLRPAQMQILQQSLDKLSSASVRIGQVYYDYKPANLLYQTAQLYLVDPPDTLWRGVLLWDFACFYSSMRRHTWRMLLRRPTHLRRRTIVRQGIVAFERSYRASLEHRHPDPDYFMLAVRLLELQRTAVLMTMQKAKVSLTRQNMPIARGKRLGHPLANRMTLPLLEIEKGWLFRQLARELS